MTNQSPPSVPRVPPDRAAAFRAAGLWDNRRLADGIEAAAAEQPEELALADDGSRLSWSELDAAVASAVAALAAEGVHAGDPVVLVAANTAPSAVAVHALLRVGAATLLLDRRCGPADIEAATTALGDHPRLLLPERERERLVPAHGEVLTVEHLVGPGPEARRLPEPDRDTAAIVLLTSGTTGRPKAVVHSVNTLTAGAHNLADITGIGADDALFLVSPLASITGVMQLLVAADHHVALVLEDAFEPASALDRIRELGATVLGGAPVIAERLLEAARRRGGHRIALRTLALGGAMLPRPLLEEAMDDFGLEIARVYGSSEAPNFSGSAPTDDRERRLSDDGALMPGSEVRIGSAEHPDEGLVRGPGVFLGYLDPSDDAAAFEDGWYRTGDLVEVHAGRLTVTGRLKEIVNRNGLKISPSEVDQALTGLPGAAELACFGVPDPETGERLVVAVRPLEGGHVSLDAVAAFLTDRGVARRKLPEQLVVWDGPLPRTATGKVVRSRLVMEAPAHPAELAPRLR